jgi:hypothetical protein
MDPDPDMNYSQNSEVFQGSKMELWTVKMEALTLKIEA